MPCTSYLKLIYDFYRTYCYIIESYQALHHMDLVDGCYKRVVLSAILGVDLR